MCGRFTFSMDMEELAEAFPGVDFSIYFEPNYNIAPSQDVLAISNIDASKATLLRWGLVPHWAKDITIGNKMINARGETLAEKPSFKHPYKRQRCLIVADGFYEWKKEQDKKTPMHIRMKTKKPFAFAGLWERWSPPDQGPLFSCTIITTDANDLLAPVHHRMPVILQPEDYDLWLSSKEQPAENLNHLLTAYPSDEMICYPVSRMVNNPKNNSPECIKPVA